jgi:formylglycine-generating enzyme required for sulfatase activity/serine/threonine protein kinase
MGLHALQPGYMLAEYQIDRLLGEGGFGLTYLAFDTHLEKKVAIKEYMPSDFCVRQNSTTIVAKSEASKMDYEWGLNAFIDEAKTLAKFDDPNIVRVFRFFKSNGTAYLVMEYLEGGCFSARYSQLNPMSESQIRKLFSPIMNGLQLVHDGGVLHRDIKPDNLMFRADGTPVLIDFGAARQQVVSKSKPITALLTPGYAPLEQYGSKGDRLGPWTDIYSLAAVAYSCLTGKIPPDASDRVIEDEIEKLAGSPQASKFLQSLDKALSIQSINRPQNLGEWYAEWGDEFEELPAKPASKPKVKSEFIIDDIKENDDVIEIAGDNDLIGESEIAEQVASPVSNSITQTELPASHRYRLFFSVILVALAGGGFYIYQQKQNLIEEELQYWDRTSQQMSISAYEDYLARWPDGIHNDDATKNLKKLREQFEIENQRVANAEASRMEEVENIEAKLKNLEMAENKRIEIAAAEKHSVFINQVIGVMLTIPSGSFVMGSNESDDEKPIHHVDISPFKMGQTEVTFAQWDACVASGGCSYKPDDQGWGRGNRPVINVSYQHITQQFIPWLNEASEQVFRLPSEAEWEYAARASSTAKYSWGNNINCSHARYGSDDSGDCGSDGKTAPVKSFPVNAFGLYDMHGNVWEWTEDCWNANYDGAPINGVAWNAGDCSSRVLRGGSWNFAAAYLRSTYRNRSLTTNRYDSLGFRLVQDLK